MLHTLHSISIQNKHHFILSAVKFYTNNVDKNASIKLRGHGNDCCLLQPFIIHKILQIWLGLFLMFLSPVIPLSGQGPGDQIYLAEVGSEGPYQQPVFQTTGQKGWRGFERVCDRLVLDHKNDL